MPAIVTGSEESHVTTQMIGVWKDSLANHMRWW